MKRLLAAVAAAALATAGLAPATVARAAAPARWSWAPSGFHGGGFQNVLAVDPHASKAGKVIVGGELHGFHLSSDNGNEWRTSNLGIGNEAGLAVGSIVFSKRHDNLVYAGVGTTEGGGFLASTDGGKSWEFRVRGAGAPHLSAIRQGCGPGMHPRPIGDLIALDERASGDAIYMGTFDDGLQRSKDGGRTWKVIALRPSATGPAYIRALAADPRDPTTLYAGVCNANGFEGAYKITNARGRRPRVTKLKAAPALVEEFAFVGKKLYAVANSSGVYKVTNGGSTWRKLGGRFLGTSAWGAIDGYVSKRTGTAVLFAGASQPQRNANGMYRSIARSKDGGATWKWITVDRRRIHPEIAGTTEKWWLLRDVPAMGLGGANFDVGQLVVDPHRNKTVFVAGRAGVWRSDNGGNDWRPAVRHLGTSLGLSVAARGARVYAGMGDWSFVGSADHGATFRRIRPGGGTYGYSVAVANDGTVYAGPGHKTTNSSGAVYESADPLTQPWTSTGLPTSNRPADIVTGTDATGRTVVIAAIEQDGIYRKVGNEDWTQVAPELRAEGGVSDIGADLAWPGDGNVYLGDDEKGVWRSTDRGQTWERFWSVSAEWIAGDPTTPGELYVSAFGRGLFRIDDARTGKVSDGTIDPVDLDVPQPGPVAVGGDGSVYVARLGTPASLWRSRPANNGAPGSWEDVSTGFYKGAAAFPRELAVSSDDFLYVALRHNGIVVGSPQIS